jgi:ATP-binding cassette subfamily B protein
MKNFTHYKQHDTMDCGPTCLRMVAKYYDKSFSLQHLRNLCNIDRQGVSLLGINQAAEKLGFRTRAMKLSFEDLQEIHLPCIVHWGQNHFVVVYKINQKNVWVSDPGIGNVKYTHEEFLKKWISTISNETEVGVALELQTTPDFFAQDEVINKTGFAFLFKYLYSYKKLITQLVLGLLIGSLLQLAFPFLTQAIVDFGIQNQDISFIYLILIAQLVLFFSQSIVDVIRGWILLHIGTRINIALISDFLIKMLKLPLGFFDSKMIGDLLQRIQDHSRIETFLTSSSLGVLFSVFNLIIFGIVLLIYSPIIFLVFLVSSIVYLLWVFVFLNRRKIIDHEKFKQLSDNRSHLIQIINGVQDIKLNNSETVKRWEWENIQAKLFKVNIKSLTLEQTQGIGAQIINQLKNILIVFLAAKAVIDGQMTLGMMMAVQYIVGQLNSPINQLIDFVRSAQDAKISLERLGEIHNADNEENDDEKVDVLPPNGTLKLEKISFSYGGPTKPKALDNVSFSIPEGKTTAIVGTSGSGKTTLVKLLLKFYDPQEGSIKVGDTYLKNIRNNVWRKKCGVVMQDGFIFNDTIAKNIAFGEEYIDTKKLQYAVHVANIQTVIDALPLGYNTKIGNEGIGLSAGQKQRLLIARAVYKNPDYLFFDEATNALDANNEKIIMQNLEEFSKNKTVIVVAHRLSTVKNADQILVLEQGKLIEQGTHQTLAAQKGKYYELVKNQLDLE